MPNTDRHERSEDQLGYRPRILTTQVGDIDLQIPKLRTASFLPSILEPRRRVGQGPLCGVMEAYVARVSTRAESMASIPALEELPMQPSLQEATT